MSFVSGGPSSGSSRGSDNRSLVFFFVLFVPVFVCSFNFLLIN